MMTQPITFGVVLFIALGLAACAERQPETERQADHATYQVKATAETARTPQEKIAEAKALLAEAKAELAEEGKYACCTKHPCNTCALEHHSCNCYQALKDNKPVCNECYAGWQRGDGVNTAIDKATVRTKYTGHAH